MEADSSEQLCYGSLTTLEMYHCGLETWLGLDVALGLRLLPEDITDY